MNQREYELIAELLRDDSKDWRYMVHGPNELRIQRHLTTVFANKLEKEYPNFNRNKFIEACEERRN